VGSLFKFLGRLARKIWKKIKGHSAKAMKKLKKRLKKLKERAQAIAPVVVSEQVAATGSKVFKVAVLSAIASGMIASGLAETPVGAPVTVLIGGEITRTTQQIWSTQ
jgi:hypothetical protein